MYVLSVQYSCAVVSVFLFGGRANLVLLTLFYSTLLTLTDGQTDGETHSLRVGWRNLPTLRVGWRNLFSSCADVFVFGSGGKQVLVVHTTMYLEYHTVVVLCQFFWFLREIVFGVTLLSVQYSCAVVSFLLLWRESYFCTNFFVESKFSSCTQEIFFSYIRNHSLKISRTFYASRNS